MRFFSILVLLFFHMGHIGNLTHLYGGEYTFLYVDQDKTENGRYNVFQDMTKDVFEYLHSRSDLRSIHFKCVDFPAPLEIGEEGYRYLAQLPQVEKLVLGSDQKSSDLNDKYLHYLQPMKNLRYFYICTNTISDEGFEMFKMFPHLEQLGIPNAAISDPGLKKLANLKNLQENLHLLQISNCLNITDEGVKSTIALKRLSNLYIQGCRFSGAGLKRLDLKVLWANRSAINDEGLRCIAGMKNLRSLDLSFCENITDAGLGKLASLLQLEELCLSGCKQITDLGLRNLAALKNLRKLELCGCEKITDQGLQSLASLVNLRELHLENCSGFTDQGLQSLASLVNLRELYLDNCSGITGEGFQKLSALTRLNIVHLNFCAQLNDSGLRGLAVLKELRELHLACCEGITDSGLQNLTPLTKLEWLNLNCCSQITDAGLKHITALKKLRILDLDECEELTDVGLRSLKLKQLESLSILGRSKITEKGVKAFQKKHPKCCIMEVCTGWDQ